MIAWVGIIMGLMGTVGCSMAKYGPGERPALTEGEKAMAAAIEKDLKFLTVEVGERNVMKYKELSQTADWIEGEFKEMGLAVNRQEYFAENIPMWGENVMQWNQMPFYNIEAELKGSGGGVIVVGAHYDSAGGVGANDNGSGVAVMLETARAMAGDKCEKTVRFVAFTNEESPFFETAYRGSRVYAKKCKERGDRIEGMICLDTVGYYSEKKGTQGYPVMAGKWVYGDRANFLMFIGDIPSCDLTERSSRLFRENATINCERLVYPESWVKEPGSSDMASFWELGYPAVSVTDTAMMRSRAMHTPGDRMELLDMGDLGRVTSGMVGVVRGLSGSDKR